MCLGEKEFIGEGDSDLYKTTEGSLAFVWAASIREQMGLSRHRNASRCHTCLWKAKAKFSKSCRQHACPWALQAIMISEKA